MPDDSQSISPPSRLLLALEGRALMEFWTFFLALPTYYPLPRGDGHPVLVLPGFGAGDWYMLPLRMFLKNLGYAAHGWGPRLNLP